jgi:hypothetical protein
MPRIFRSMLDDGGKPKVGSASKMLGVRVAPNPHPDIPVDGNGDVHPNTGGMSVAPEWRKLPDHLIPRRLKHLIPRARGRDDLVCWRLDDLEFFDGQPIGLSVLRVDPAQLDNHGFIEPASLMSIAEFQSALSSTCEDWVPDEN